jgi:hypothetical protein
MNEDPLLAMMDEWGERLRAGIPGCLGDEHSWAPATVGRTYCLKCGWEVAPQW